MMGEDTGEDVFDEETVIDAEEVYLLLSDR